MSIDGLRIEFGAERSQNFLLVTKFTNSQFMLIRSILWDFSFQALFQNIEKKGFQQFEESLENSSFKKLTLSGG